MMDFLTLSQLNSIIAEKIQRSFPEACWLLAETSDVRLNSNGHCYLEFIEREEKSGNINAKAKAYIWRNTFQILKPYFEEKTGQSFVSGIKVLVKVSIDFHPVYGYGLNVCDIDPTYTLGDIQRRRQEILRQLDEEGIIDMNKELPTPLTPQRIAVITSPTAAGYEDFLDHLFRGKHGFAFYTHLFPAVMQGEQTESSIIAALEKIFIHRNLFDVIVIIRGGGASSDLLAFDSYLLASHCAQFPLPVITGIGHERDNTALDFVAHHRAKTPTAVADYLVKLMEETRENLMATQDSIVEGIVQTIDLMEENLQKMRMYFPLHLNTVLERQNHALATLMLDIHRNTKQFFQDKKTILKEKESFFHLSSPEHILSMGYSITLKDGKAVKSAQMLKKGNMLQTRLADGEVVSVVV
jgi:exodeoxyribonuclease VII large subunit